MEEWQKDQWLHDERLKRTLWHIADGWNPLCDEVRRLGDSARNEQKRKSERLNNFALGFSVFTLVFVLFVELIVKK